MYDKTVLDELSYQNVPGVIVGVTLPDDAPFGDEPLDEISSLCSTAGIRVRAAIHQNRKDIDPTYYVGKGKATEISEAVKESGAKLVVFDNDLKPGHQKNLEEVCGCAVIDRTELILAIFNQHARTRQARVQVELARAEYALPRLKNLWSHLERQRGALSAVGGAGERQIELDRRMLKKRIQRLQDELKEILKRREIEVARRSDLFQVAIVGYTNAGKSTLMNALTQEGVLAEDKLFATLDTRTCIWKLPDHKVLLSDTVGFIRNLPHKLVASFQATLEEVREADLLLHVVDVSHPAAQEMIEAVNTVLREIGAEANRTLMIFNKIDRAHDKPLLAQLHARYPDCVNISAATGEGLPALSTRVQEIVEERETSVDWTFSAANGKLLAYLKQHGKILGLEYIENDVRVRALLEPRFVATATELRDRG
ncbi:MAG: GTPase HflX [Planctomycetaceae bacterium]|nr:GTPase HflX [Planctomycetota bacterium]NUO16005.1 GTPase HflX [Planctomycetaceae bacterium]GIK53362.1 MAG: GTPase HflX [Planctomycetota bacterium]